MPSIQSASPERPKPGCVGAHTVKCSETCSSQRVQPRLPPAPWSTSSGSPCPPTHTCTSTPPTLIVSSRARMPYVTPFPRRARSSSQFERRLRRRNPELGEASEGAVEAPSDLKSCLLQHGADVLGRRLLAALDPVNHVDRGGRDGRW